MEYIENDFLFVPWRTLIMDCRGDILTAEGGCLYNFFFERTTSGYSS